MEALAAAAVPRWGVGRAFVTGPAAAVLLLGAPLLLLAWLLRLPAPAPTPDIAFEHLVIVANVSLLALLVALLVARSAIEQRAYRVLLAALGFLAMGGFFAVHALSTPGVILPVSTLVYEGGAYHQTHGAASVLGISAYLSLLLPAVLFAARHLPLNWHARHSLRTPARTAAIAAAMVLILYGVLGLRAPDSLAILPLLQPPFAYMAAGLTSCLLLFAAWRQAREFRSSSLPTHAAQVAALLLLTDAQVAMVLSPIWSPAWWEYHALMLLAVASALVALFIELDRRRGFERFLSPAVIERVMSGATIQMGGERRVVTVLFGDLRGSTALAEKLPADEVVGVLNTYVGAMAQCVFDAGGMLDKFLGDGLMAIFGVLPDPSHGAQAAVEAARAIRASLGALNMQRAQAGLPEIGFGMGIHTGEVVLGAVGLPQRSDFTAIGDTVNTASRLESLCKEYRVDSVLSADVAALLNLKESPVSRLGTASIRGKEHPVEVFTLAGA